MSFMKMGPTELRILLAAGNLALWNNPDATLAGTDWKIFDVGAAIGAVALLGMMAIAVPKSVRVLYDAERLPPGLKPCATPASSPRRSAPPFPPRAA
jgi:hypothetical protein